ncbi:hypothetical protein ACFOSE_00425, partial [Streptococcus dentapri]
MTNWNLESFDNIYASLAEGAYTNRPKNFPIEELDPKQQKQLKEGKAIEFDFSSNEGGTKGATGDGYPDKSDPNASKTELYLQPDETLHTTKDGHQKG